MLDRVRAILRARHYSRRTEESYVAWIRRFIHFHERRHPADLGEPEITCFVSALATERQVGASTQNQALAALLFLSERVLERDIAWLEGIVHAKRPDRLPVVLSRGEVSAVLAHMHGIERPCAALIYGAGPTQVFQYLGRYTHRVGLSNQRLVSFDGHDVCFRTKHGKTAIVEAVEFVRRFLLHVLPTGFVKIRHYGLVAAANATTRLEIARRLLLNQDDTPNAAPGEPKPPVGWRDLLLALTGIDLLLCPACGGRSMERQPLPRRYPQPVSRTDTS